MTRSNLYITLSDGREIICVADSSSAPEQGYFVEQVLLPLLRTGNAADELELLVEHCTTDGQLRLNADYRYEIDLVQCKVAFFEEKYDWGAEIFRRGKCLNDRLLAYLRLESEIEKFVKGLFKGVTNKGLIVRANALPDCEWDDEATELPRRWRTSGFSFHYVLQGNKLIIIRDNEN